MTIYEQVACTQKIWTNPKFFHFKENEKSWQHCEIITMAGSQNMRFQKGRTTVDLLRNSPLIARNQCTIHMRLVV
jgi:hypothetical protein